MFPLNLLVGCVVASKVYIKVAYGLEKVCIGLCKCCKCPVTKASYIAQTNHLCISVFPKANGELECFVHV